MRPTFAKMPGDGKDRPTERTETTQSFQETRQASKVRPVAAPPGQSAGPSPQAPGNGLIVIPQGILKGSGGKLFSAVPQSDYEQWLQNPTVDGYVLSSTAAGLRSWVPLSGTGGYYGGTVTSVGLSVAAPLGQVSGSPVTVSGILAVSYPAVVTLVDAATIAVNAALGSTFKVTLGGNRTLGTPTGAVDGQKLAFLIKQDGAGSRLLTLDAGYRLGTTVSSVTLSTAAGTVDWLGVIYNADDTAFDVVAFVKGYL